MLLPVNVKWTYRYRKQSAFQAPSWNALPQPWANRLSGGPRCFFAVWSWCWPSWRYSCPGFALPDGFALGGKTPLPQPCGSWLCCCGATRGSETWTPYQRKLAWPSRMWLWDFSLFRTEHGKIHFVLSRKDAQCLPLERKIFPSHIVIIFKLIFWNVLCGFFYILLDFIRNFKRADFKKWVSLTRKRITCSHSIWKREFGISTLVIFI